MFIPLSIYISKYSISSKLLKNKVYFLIFLTILVFFSRNVSRLNKEYKVYNYNPVNKAYYNINQLNFKIDKRIKKINRCIDKKNYENCGDPYIKSKKFYFSYIFYRDF